MHLWEQFWKSIESVLCCFTNWPCNESYFKNQSSQAHTETIQNVVITVKFQQTACKCMSIFRTRLVKYTSTCVGSKTMSPNIAFLAEQVLILRMLIITTLHLFLFVFTHISPLDETTKSRDLCLFHSSSWQLNIVILRDKTSLLPLPQGHLLEN